MFLIIFDITYKYLLYLQEQDIKYQPNSQSIVSQKFNVTYLTLNININRLYILLYYLKNIIAQTAYIRLQVFTVQLQIVTDINDKTVNAVASECLDDKERDKGNCMFIVLSNYNSSINCMLLGDSLVEVLQSFSFTSYSTIRKTIFDITINGNIYTDTFSFLTETCVIFRPKLQHDSVYLKVQFHFDLLFSVQFSKNEPSNSKVVNSIKLEKGQNYLTINSSKSEKQFDFWRQFFEKTLNQKGFHDQFKAIKKIGKGSFATVYLVEKLQDNIKYAVKSFSKELLYSQQKGKQSLIKEIESMRKFNHKNIIKIYGVYQTQHSIYIVLQLLQGGALSDRIAKRYKNTTLQIKMIMKTILEGLECMHKKHFMHRDIKPQNILFRRADSCQCVIADFGLAENELANNYLFIRCGTPGFVAPQIVNLKDKNARYTFACDLFSVGIIFHMLLLKKSPFSGKQYNQVLSENRACNLNFDSYQYKQLPQTSLNLLQRLLEKDPSKRITASQALKHAFFYSEFTMWENNKKINHFQIKTKFHKEEITNQEQGQSPLMMTRSNQRKKIIRIRQDSCLKFKMKENLMIAENIQLGQKVQDIDIPKAFNRFGTKILSKFKKTI